MSELKPCPFCGGAADPHGWLDGSGKRGPECEDCGATAMSAEAWSRRTLPEGMALVTQEITAETGHKAGMIGDFMETVEVMCSECEQNDPDPDCGECGGEFFYQQDVPVSWTTIKAIHKRIVEIAEASE